MNSEEPMPHSTSRDAPAASAGSSADAPAAGSQWDAVRRFAAEVLAPIKEAFVGKDEIVDLLGVSLIAHENLFLLGPPGTAKSALVRELTRRLNGQMFDYLLTRFTEPNELFGPFDIRKLRDGDLVTNTEGMLPEAEFVFLDELLNANSAILNSLLMVLNERVFRRGRETRQLPLISVVGTSNNLPEDDALAALFDRFLLRARCDNLGPDLLGDVISAGWQLETRPETPATMSVDDVRGLHRMLRDADFGAVRDDYIELVHRLRNAGVQISDRRAVKLQRLLAASALLCCRHAVNRTDLWVLRYIWDTDEQQEVLAAIVDEAVARADEQERAAAHAQSSRENRPDPDKLAQDMDKIRSKMDDLSEVQRAQMLDQASVIAGRCQWIEDAQQRSFLQEKADQLLKELGASS